MEMPRINNHLNANARFFKMFPQTHCHNKPTTHKRWNSFHKYNTIKPCTRFRAMKRHTYIHFNIFRKYTIYFHRGFLVISWIQTWDTILTVLVLKWHFLTFIRMRTFYPKLYRQSKYQHWKAQPVYNTKIMDYWLWCTYTEQKKRKVSFWRSNLSQFSLKVNIWVIKYC